MKIAFLTPEYPHPRTGSSGGIGTSIMNLSRGLILQGHQVSLLIYGQQKDDFFQENRINYYCIKNIKFKGLSRYLTQKKIEKLINTLVLENKIDIIEAPDWTGITSFIQPNCPIVIRLNGSDTYFCHLDHRPVKRHNKFHEKRALEKANALISVSQFTADLTNKLFRFNKNFTIIPNGINVDLFDKTIVNSRSFNAVEESQNGKTILYFGTLIRKKGLLELPLIFNEIVKKDRIVKLILVGKDASDSISGNASTWQMMQDLFTPEALSCVNYKGSVPYDEIKVIINSATVCVFPSLAEALPVSWIEAMAIQKAIVASNIGWATEVIDDGLNGFLVNPKNHLEYANKILKLLENSELRKQFGIKARMKVENQFSNIIVAQNSVDFYKNSIELYYKTNQKI
jgi:glycosyltransferase involved in cell wall biosynthesis